MLQVLSLVTLLAAQPPSDQLGFEGDFFAAGCSIEIETRTRSTGEDDVRKIPCSRALLEQPDRSGGVLTLSYGQDERLTMLLGRKPGNRLVISVAIPRGTAWQAGESTCDLGSLGGFCHADISDDEHERDVTVVLQPLRPLR